MKNKNTARNSRVVPRADTMPLNLAAQNDMPLAGLPHQPVKSHKKARIISSVIVVLILIGLGGGTVYKNHRDAEQAAAQQQLKPSATTSSSTSGGLLTYLSQNNAQYLLVTNENQRVVARIALPVEDSTFTVLANNGQEVLAEALFDEGGQIDNTTYNLISQNGTVTALPSNVARILDTATAGAGGFLGNNDDYVFVSCAAPTCTLNDLNLSSGVETTITTLPFTGGTTAQSSLYLLGVSVNGTAYVLENGVGTQTPGQLLEVLLSNQGTVKTLPMAAGALNPPIMTTDNRTLIYTDQADSETPEIMNLTTGKTTAVRTTQIDGGATYLLSPNNQKAAYVVNTGPSSGKPVTVAYISLADGAITLLKSFGDPTTNQVTLNGWVSDAQLNYALSQTSTPNSFTAVPKLYSLNVSTKATGSASGPSGYMLVSPDTL